MIRRLARSAAWGAAVLAVLILLSACGGSNTRPFADDAARVVPADALAFVDLSLDRSDAAVAQLTSTVRGLPGYDRLLRGLQARLAAISGAAYASRIRPWLGGEAAVAFVPAGASASELIVLGVRNRALARRFVSDVHAAGARLLKGYVVLGEPALVAAAGRGRSLAGDPGFRHAVAGAPDAAVVDAYGTGTGLSELLGGRGGLAGVAATLLSEEDPTRVVAALLPTGDGVEVWVRLIGPAGGSASAGFRPALAQRLPADTDWVVQMPSLTGSAPGLLSLLAAATSRNSAGAPGSGASGASAVRDFVARLGPALRAEGISAPALSSLFDHPSAIFALGGGLGVMTSTSDPATARAAIGEAGGALAELFAGGGAGASPPFVATTAVHGVEVTQWQPSPGSQLDAAVFDHVIVLTSSSRTIDALLAPHDPLSATSLYRSVLAGLGPSRGPVLYGAINRLVRGSARSGLLGSLGLDGAAEALAHVSAAGLSSTGGQSSTTAELFFTIS